MGCYWGKIFKPTLHICENGFAQKMVLNPKITN